VLLVVSGFTPVARHLPDASLKVATGDSYGGALLLVPILMGRRGDLEAPNLRGHKMAEDMAQQLPLKLELALFADIKQAVTWLQKELVMVVAIL